MFHRFHGGRRGKTHSTGKWQSVRRPGIAGAKTEREGDWEITLTQRQTGTTIRREVFSVTIRADNPKQEEFLTGFSSRNAALAAARRRIKVLDYVRRRQAERELVRRGVGRSRSQD